MPLRPARCYRYFDTPPYTRKEYIRSIPYPKITKFDLGNTRLKDYEIEVCLVAEEAGQIRDNALEAVRIITNKYLSAGMGDQNYHFTVCVYPHHILRENKMIVGAGADRLQEGMTKAFGKPIGTAARVRAGQTILRVRTFKQFYPVVKEAFKVASKKLPVRTRIKITKGMELLQGQL